jgi:hypothetical protein
MWEYSGNLRYSLLIGRFQPFIKGGPGYSIYKVKNMKIGEMPLKTSETEWFHNPTPPWLPNTWQIGTGFEFLPLISHPSMKSSLVIYGIKLGTRFEYELYLHRLGKDAPENVFVTRHQINLLLTLSL